MSESLYFGDRHFKTSYLPETLVRINENISFRNNSVAYPVKDLHLESNRMLEQIDETSASAAPTDFKITIFRFFSFQTPCFGEPCNNGATCKPKYNEGSYECQCLGGFGGKNCQGIY